MHTIFKQVHNYGRLPSYLRTCMYFKAMHVHTYVRRYMWEEYHYIQTSVTKLCSMDRYFSVKTVARDLGTMLLERNFPAEEFRFVHFIVSRCDR